MSIKILAVLVMLFTLGLIVASGVVLYRGFKER